ncbi:MAG: VWA domain-containing protein [Treponema sp.]|nr:VWA domain-containing protein [Treponema sp.]
MRRFLYIALLFPAFSPVFAQNLSIEPGDLRIEQRIDGGFHLFIRKKGDIASVLLTESTKDPALRADNYAYRAGEWNAVNGDEIRILDGVPLSRETRIYSLIDSTPEEHPELGRAFHIYIPYILYYGYESGRHGEVYVTDGTYFNIRAFSLPSGDYRGSFKDNPFVLHVTQRPLPGPPEENYMKDTVRAFTEIAGPENLVYSTGPDDLVERIRNLLEREKGKKVDLVLCLDTTGSMKDDIDAVRKMLIPMLKEIIAEFSAFRIGMVLYKDYYDEYLNRVIPFTGDFNRFQRTLNSIRVSGGRDIPEAVYEALYEGVIKFPWEAESRLMILIGDAPPHPRPLGKISKEMVDEEVTRRALKVQAIILPQ